MTETQALQLGAKRLVTMREARFFETVRKWGPESPFRGQAMPPAWSVMETQGLVDLDGRTRLIFTYDVGPHSAGWWRNSEYERCWHLSLSARDRHGEAELPTPAEIRAWAKVAFGDETVRLWEEPPARYGDPHRPHGHAITHLRLFVDEHMQPITPQGEVYTLVPFKDGTSPEKVFR